MEFEDFVQPEVGVTAAVVAVIASPQVRKVVRRGAVLGLAGILMAGDAVTAFGRGLSRGAQSATNGHATQSANGQSDQTDQSADAQHTVEATTVTEEAGYQQGDGAQY